jgi:hypothetical protein
MYWYVRTEYVKALPESRDCNRILKRQGMYCIALYGEYNTVIIVFCTYSTVHYGILPSLQAERDVSHIHTYSMLCPYRSQCNHYCRYGLKW